MNIMSYTINWPIIIITNKFYNILVYFLNIKPQYLQFFFLLSGLEVLGYSAIFFLSYQKF